METYRTNLVDHELSFWHLIRKQLKSFPTAAADRCTTRLYDIPRVQWFSKGMLGSRSGNKAAVWFIIKKSFFLVRAYF